jgi:hypothetical protein
MVSIPPSDYDALIDLVNAGRGWTRAKWDEELVASGFCPDHFPLHLGECPCTKEAA